MKRVRVVVTLCVVLFAAVMHAAEPSTMVYRTVDGQSLHAYVFEPASPEGTRSAILLFHGGGWSEGAADWMVPSAQRFADRGMVAISIEYRLANDTTTPIDALADVCSAFQWTRSHAKELRIDPKRVAGYGVSAGGHLLASTVTVGCPSSKPNPKPDAILLLSPAVDVGRDAWFGKLLKGRGTSAAQSPVEHVTSRTPPTMIVQGAEDTLTPTASAKRYCDEAVKRGSTCELVLFPNLGHLLTKNLANQESDYDPDQQARDEGNRKQLDFLQRLGFLR